MKRQDRGCQPGLFMCNCAVQQKGAASPGGQQMFRPTSSLLWWYPQQSMQPLPAHVLLRCRAADVVSAHP